MKKNVIIGVCGGIGAYKVPDIISILKKQNVDVTVILTENACKFVTPLTFQTISQNKVYTDMFKVADTWEVEHIELAKKADLMLVVPATLNCIGKAAFGIADDMLGTVLMATKAPVIFAPAMNTNMYLNPIFEENVKRLKSFGYKFIDAVSGNLACGDFGKGKLAPVQEIADIVLEVLKGVKKQDVCGESKAFEEKPPAKNDLAGKKIIVTAGPTVEQIDPVRYITNRSSGKMGFAIAEAAYERGAKVTLITGPVKLSSSPGIHRVDILSTEDMLSAVSEHFESADALIKAAAPADYRPEKKEEQKIKKKEGGLSLNLVRNPDILEIMGQRKKDKILVGFAAETNDVLAYAKEKIHKKNLDFIVANNVSSEGAGFGHDTNIITIIDSEGKVKEHDKMTKAKAADAILDKLVQYF